MSFGTGIVLIVLGLILLTGVVQVDIPGINEQALGLILLLGGISAITIMRTWLNGRGTYVAPDRPISTRVVEREVQAPPANPGRVVEREVIERDVQDPNYR